MNRLRVAIWCERNHAMGRVHSDIIRHLSHLFEFTYYDWHDVNSNQRLFNDDWHDYDVIISNSTITYFPQHNGLLNGDVPPALSAKYAVIMHAPILNHSFFTEKVYALSGASYGAVSQQAVSVLKGALPSGTHVEFLPFGVSVDAFTPHQRQPQHNTLKRAGFVGRRDAHSAWNEVKRPDMFEDICRQSGMEPVYIHDIPLSQSGEMYDNIDILVCCSTFECGPLGVFEAAACNIPVISTRVGNAGTLRELKTFETVEQAVALVEDLRNDQYCREYVSRLSNEVRSEWDAKLLLERHMVPFIRRAALNSSYQQN